MTKHLNLEFIDQYAMGTCRSQIQDMETCRSQIQDMKTCRSKIQNMETCQSFNLTVNATVYLKHLGAIWKGRNDEIYEIDDTTIYFADGDIYIDRPTNLYETIIVHTNDYDTDYTDEYIMICKLQDITKINEICIFAIECCNKYLSKNVELNINFYCLHINASNDITVNAIKKNFQKIESYEIKQKHIKVTTKHNKNLLGKTRRNDPWIYYKKNYDINIFVASTIKDLIQAYNYVKIYCK